MNNLTEIAQKMYHICKKHALPGRFCIATTRLPRGLGLALEIHPDEVTWRLTLSRPLKIPSDQEIAACQEAFNASVATVNHGQVFSHTGKLCHIVRLQWKEEEKQPSLLEEEETA